MPTLFSILKMAPPEIFLGVYVVRLFVQRLDKSPYT